MESDAMQIQTTRANNCIIEEIAKNMAKTNESIAEKSNVLLALVGGRISELAPVE